MAIAVKVKRSKSGARQRPLSFLAPLVLAHYIKPHLRHLQNTVFNPLQPMVVPLDVSREIVEARIAHVARSNDGVLRCPFGTAVSRWRNNDELIIPGRGAVAVLLQQGEKLQSVVDAKIVPRVDVQGWDIEAVCALYVAELFPPGIRGCVGCK